MVPLNNQFLFNLIPDLYILDTSTMSWSVITPPVKNLEGQPNPGPSARAGHTATAVGKKVLIFGGGDGIKILNDTWFLDPITFVSFSADSSHCNLCLLYRYGCVQRSAAQHLQDGVLTLQT
jgi:hypothetical protein